MLLQPTSASSHQDLLWSYLFGILWVSLDICVVLQFEEIFGFSFIEYIFCAVTTFSFQVFLHFEYCLFDVFKVLENVILFFSLYLIGNYFEISHLYISSD